ncbi:hypothetical protein KR054_009119 [Drosophila jambulina]|nr:hypothetical protein KR054_009119 [Drosophila jambulina]
MVIQNDYPGWLVVFFHKMDTKDCVVVCSTVVYILAMDHFMLTFGAITANHLLVGVWLLVNITVFVLTLFTGLMSGWALLRLVVMGYCIIVVRSYYENLIAPPTEDEATIDYIRVEYSEEEA